jgi:hypothetical protein
MDTDSPLRRQPDVPLSRTRASSVPLLAAFLATALATGYGIVLGYEPTLPDPESAALFVLVFGALGAGIALTVRSTPVAAVAGLLGLLVFPVGITTVAGVPSQPLSVVHLLPAGGGALGLFLLAAGAETLLRVPASVQAVLTSRDALAGGLIGLLLTVPTFLSWTVPVSGYSSLTVQLIHTTVIATRGGFLVAAVLVAVLFLTRRQSVAPVLLVASAFLTAASGTGSGEYVWSATPALLAESSLILLALTVAVGFFELSVRASVARMVAGRTSGVN